VFDMLTRDQLYRLHDSLHQSHGKLHDRLCGPAREIGFGPDWDIAHTAACDLTAMMVEVVAELGRRETAHA